MSGGRKHPRYDAPVDAMRAAGAWLARRDRGFASGEAERFAAWRAADPAHAAAVAQLERTLSAFDGLKEFAPSADRGPDPDYFAPRRARRRWFPLSLGFAAAAALAVLFWGPRMNRAPETRGFATEQAARERFALPDGSIIDLNAGTQVETTFSRSERRVRLLRGEAHFQVAKDAARPFVVTIGSVSVRAIGTAFNIRFEPRGVEVLVTHGRVAVEEATGSSVGRARKPVHSSPGRRWSFRPEARRAARRLRRSLRPRCSGNWPGCRRCGPCTRRRWPTLWPNSTAAMARSS